MAGRQTLVAVEDPNANREKGSSVTQCNAGLNPEIPKGEGGTGEKYNLYSGIILLKCM